MIFLKIGDKMIRNLSIYSYNRENTYKVYPVQPISATTNNMKKNKDEQPKKRFDEVLISEIARQKASKGK